MPVVRKFEREKMLHVQTFERNEMGLTGICAIVERISSEMAASRLLMRLSPLETDRGRLLPRLDPFGRFASADQE
jgi:hypothetical protein